MIRSIFTSLLVIFALTGSLHAGAQTSTPTAAQVGQITAAAPAAPASLSRWPYVESVTSTSATIAWGTNTGGSSEVRYSADHSYGLVAAASTHSASGQSIAVAVLNGLQPGTRYYYRVRTGGVDLTPWSSVSFCTATAAGSFSFVAFGDSRDGSSSAVSVANQMAKWPFDLALHDGDIVSNGLATEYDPMYFAIYRAMIGKAPFYIAIGNHEYDGDSTPAFLGNFQLPQNGPAGLQGQAYSFNWGNAHFVVLDTNTSYSAGSAQYNWLRNDLANSHQTWKFVLDHHPPYSSGTSHGSDTNVRNDLGPLFEQYGVDLMFSGHDHDYERTFPMYGGHVATAGERGITYIVTGGGGAPLYAVGHNSFTAYAKSVNHFTRTVIQDCTLTLQAIDTNGAVFDSLTLNKCAARGALRRYMPAVFDNARLNK